MRTCPMCSERPINTSGFCDTCEPIRAQDEAEVEANDLLLAFVDEFRLMGPEAKTKIREELNRRMNQ